jgi:isoleucyl-tRNA synthetase
MTSVESALESCIGPDFPDVGRVPGLKAIGLQSTKYTEAHSTPLFACSFGRTHFHQATGHRTQRAEIVQPHVPGSNARFAAAIPREELEEFFILSDLTLQPAKEPGASIALTPNKKCARCWRHRPTVGASQAHPDLCDRCESVVVAMTKSE